MVTHTVSTTDELQQRTANAGPGDKIIAAGGVYEMSSRWTVTAGGTDDNPLVIQAADGEVPHIKFVTSGDDSGVQFRSPYVHFVGFEVSDSTWKGVNTDGNAHDVVFEDLNVHDSRLWGIMNNGRDRVVFRNCDSHHNDGSPENSDGFNMTGSASNGTIVGCRSWANGDDGYDFWVSENHLIRDCWAWDNGRGTEGDGNGFKLGGSNTGGGHRVERCVAYNNRFRGFDWNTTNNPLEVVNCTAVDNDINYRFYDVAHVLKNNISVNGSVENGNVVDDENNSWNLGLNNITFRSREPSSEDFLRLTSGSAAIDAGTDVGLPYNGEAPDLGAFEYSEGGGTATRTTLDDEVTITAAAAATNVESSHDTEHDGYNDSGYINVEPDSGGFVQWAVEVPNKRTYNFEIRYANGADIDRTANLTFAGDYQQITFPQTNGWSEWDTVGGTVDLPSGNVDLAIETTGQDAGNVDQIRLWPVNNDTGSNRLALDGEITVDAAAATMNAETNVEDEHDGFKGSGYVQFEPDSGGYGQWELDVTEAQSYNFEIRYANGADIDRTANLTFAGDYQQITFSQTGSWESWETMTGTVDLPSGDVDLAIETTGQDAGNVDQIRLWPVENDGSRSEPVGDTANLGLNTPEKGTTDWHIPVNENFETIDRRIPIVDDESALAEYTPVERALYIAMNTGTVYVGDGSEWTQVGSLS